MFEPTEREVEHDVESSIEMFQRARVGEVAAIEPRQTKHILLALDGSSQDELSIVFARHFQQRFGCAVDVVDARENVTSSELADRVAQSLAAQAQPKQTGDSFQQILDAAGRCHCDLLMVPCPYGRDLESVGPDSTGTVIDVLLARSPVPLLVVRKPFEPKGEPFHRVLFVLIGENKAAQTAAQWAAGLVALSGSFELILILEQEFYEHIRGLVQTIDPAVKITAEALSEALAKTHIRLHRALQKAAAAGGFRYQLNSQREGEPALRELDEEGTHPLLVLALDRSDHASQGHVHDRIRHTPNPVLVVPTN